MVVVLSFSKYVSWRILYCIVSYRVVKFNIVSYRIVSYWRRYGMVESIQYVCVCVCVCISVSVFANRLPAGCYCIVLYVSKYRNLY